jgi:hypothetical protein
MRGWAWMGVTVAVGVRGWQISLLSFQVKKCGKGKNS